MFHSSRIRGSEFRTFAISTVQFLIERYNAMLRSIAIYACVSEKVTRKHEPKIWDVVELLCKKEKDRRKVLSTRVQIACTFRLFL